MKARFDRVSWVEPEIRFHAVLDDLDRDLWIKLPAGVGKPDDDLLAGVFASLAGPDLEEISMELDVSPPIRQAIEDFCGCTLSSGSRENVKDWLSGFDGHAVSFSGGFDSLAALALLPQGPELVSMDFGGWFQRETEFFTEFAPHVVSSNFRMEGFGRRSWIFMLAGIILLKEHYRFGKYTTGSILESSPWHYSRNIEATFKAAPLLRAFGFEQINTTIGITEVVTTLVTMRHFPDRVQKSLKSLAAPGSGKSQRKHMLVSSLYQEGRASLDYVPEVAVTSKPPLTWGESLTDDMLTPYMLKHSGVQATQALMAGIPDEIFEAAERLELNFYERYHTGLYMGLDPKFSKHLHNTLIDLGVEPFAERDWTEYREISELIGNYHSVKID
ncbi:hypothetical protein [Brevibacterium casei]|uniref:hypothetical protein n=1 Tax=Brevibacterium casei TaxID=33889 RepID=UPI0037005F48